MVLFLGLAAVALLPHVSPAISLAVGIIFGLTGRHPFPTTSARTASLLLKACVVGLGFGMPLAIVLRAGASGVWITAAGIALALVVGIALGRALNVERMTSQLISAGTAICGGSAIAAVGPAIGARSEAMSVALATVFVLNGVALYLFPAVGHALSLSQHQFGVWAAVSIHDTSSVVGAATMYGPQSLAIATVLKLTRALWIVPVTLGAVAYRRATTGADPSRKVAWPWFIGLFLVASAIRSALPEFIHWFDMLSAVARQGLVLTLFLIGAGLTRSTLRKVGMRPMVQGVLLWGLVASVSLAAVMLWDR